TNSAVAQQIVFSRRVYATQGKSFQQLWIWSADDGMLKPLTHTGRDHYRPSCSADGAQLFFESPEFPAPRHRWRLDRTTGSEQPVDDFSSSADARVPLCDDRTLSRSPDGSRIACVAKGDEEIVIVDVRSLQEIERVPFRQRFSNGEPYPPWSLESTWSPDGHQLLVGTYGENGSSTSPQLDYFVLNLATQQWTRAFTGND